MSLFGGQEVYGFFDVLGGGNQEQFVALVDYLLASRDREFFGFLIVDRDESALGREVAAFDNILDALAGDPRPFRHSSHEDVR